jgi:hypothetical protein
MPKSDRAFQPDVVAALLRAVAPDLVPAGTVLVPDDLAPPQASLEPTVIENLVKSGAVRSARAYKHIVLAWRGEEIGALVAPLDADADPEPSAKPP